MMRGSKKSKRFCSSRCPWKVCDTVSKLRIKCFGVKREHLQLWICGLGTTERGKHKHEGSKLWRKGTQEMKSVGQDRLVVRVENTRITWGQL